MNKIEELKVGYQVGASAGKDAVQKYWFVAPLAVGAVNLVRAYQKHSITEAIIAVICWFVVAPILGYWWKRQ